MKGIVIVGNSGLAELLQKLSDKGIPAEVRTYYDEPLLSEKLLQQLQPPKERRSRFPPVREYIPRVPRREKYTRRIAQYARSKI